MKKKVGEIDAKTATELKRQAGDIVLEQGDQNFGQTHIELRHGDQIRQAGYENVETFVEKVAQDKINCCVKDRTLPTSPEPC